MEKAFTQVLERLPFAIKEVHLDNGSEFFNAHLVRFWKEKVTGVHLSRSRPYQKNDNRYVGGAEKRHPGPAVSGQTTPGYS